MTVSFMWEFKSNPKDRKPIKNEFTVEYAVQDDITDVNTVWRLYTFNFNIVDYEVIIFLLAHTIQTCDHNDRLFNAVLTVLVISA